MDPKIWWLLILSGCLKLLWWLLNHSEYWWWSLLTYNGHDSLYIYVPLWSIMYLLSDNLPWHLAISLRWFLRFKVEISHYILYKQRSPAGWVGEWPGFCGKQHASRSHFLVTLRHCHNCCGYVDFTCLLVRFVFFWFDGVQYSLSIFRKPWSISLHPQPRWFHNRPPEFKMEATVVTMSKWRNEFPGWFRFPLTQSLRQQVASSRFRWKKIFETITVCTHRQSFK